MYHTTAVLRFVLYANQFKPGCHESVCKRPWIGIFAIVWPEKTDTCMFVSKTEA
jgi:hypothetical protein